MQYFKTRLFISDVQFDKNGHNAFEGAKQQCIKNKKSG